MSFHSARSARFNNVMNVPAPAVVVPTGNTYNLSGTSSGTSAASAIPQKVMTVSASSSGTSTTVANVQRARSLSASSTGTSSATGSSLRGRQLSASSAGSSAASAAPQRRRLESATSTGTSTASGNLKRFSTLYGTAAGSSTTSAAPQRRRLLSASSTGSSSTSATFTYIPAPLLTPIVTINPTGRSFYLAWAAVPNAVLYGIRRNGTSLTTTTYTYLTDVVPSDGVFYYEVAARDAGGNWSAYSSPQSFTVDTTPPPSPVSSAETGAYSAHLTWAATGDATGYDITRDGVLIGSTTDTYYDDTVSAIATYSYAVRSKDSNGNYSAYEAPYLVYIDQYSKLTRPSLFRAPLVQGDGSVGHAPLAELRRFTG